jgi:IS5 family transposase
MYFAASPASSPSAPGGAGRGAAHGATAAGERLQSDDPGWGKAYDTADYVAALRAERITPHVAQNITDRRGSNLDRRTTRHPGYGVSQRVRKRVEEIFGWGKTIGGWRKSRYRGTQRNGLWAYLVAAAYNLVRMVKLMPAPA